MSNGVLDILQFEFDGLNIEETITVVKSRSEKSIDLSFSSAMTSNVQCF